MLNLFSLENKNAIVTGARTGIGQAMAIGLAEAGANIIGIGRSPMPETKAAVEKLGRKFLLIQADLSETQCFETIIKEVIQEFKHIDILVNNAGIVKRNPAINFTEEDWDETLQVNLKSVFFLSQAVAKHMIEQGNGGKIINISSFHGLRGGTNSIAYNASKFGVEGITRSMAKSWAQYGINCNSIAPGYTLTDMNTRFKTDPKVAQETIAKIPAGRLANPEDFKGSIIYLASEASKHVHGIMLNVDGGWLA